VPPPFEDVERQNDFSKYLQPLWEITVWKKWTIDILKASLSKACNYRTPPSECVSWKKFIL